MSEEEATPEDDAQLIRNIAEQYALADGDHSDRIDFLEDLADQVENGEIDSYEADQQLGEHIPEEVLVGGEDPDNVDHSTARTTPEPDQQQESEPEPEPDPEPDHEPEPEPEPQPQPQPQPDPHEDQEDEGDVWIPGEDDDSGSGSESDDSGGLLDKIKNLF